MYTLAGASDLQRGWGRADETWTVSGRTRRLRRRGAVVLAGRQGHRHPPDAHPDAGRRVPALRGHRGAVRAVAARRHAAADDRRPGRDPRRGRRSRAVRARPRPRRPRRPAAGRPALPGVVDPLPGGAAGAVDHGRSAPRSPAPGRACWQAIAGRRPGADRAVQPGGLHRHDPGGPRHRRRAPRDTGAGGRGLAGDRQRPGPRPRRQVPGRDRRRVHRRGRSAGTTAPGPPAACWTPS